MTKSHSLSIAIDEPFTIHRRAQTIAETPHSSHRLWTFLSRALARMQPLPKQWSGSSYYNSAYDRACASAPVTSLRHFA
jgi:hypothetical protein